MSVTRSILDAVTFEQERENHFGFLHRQVHAVQGAGRAAKGGNARVKKLTRTAEGERPESSSGSMGEEKGGKGRCYNEYGRWDSHPQFPSRTAVLKTAAYASSATPAR